jgi:Na+/H+ antiporter NhaA
MTRFRLSPFALGSAAALYDPRPLLELQAVQQRPSRPRPRPRIRIDGTTLLVAAIGLALLWSNSPWHGTYDAFWRTPIALTVGPWTLGAGLRTWIDEGLMTLFFLVVGLEAKRERDLGELRDGRRLTVPVLAALAGIAASALVYVALTAGAGAAGGWGVAISTDTALGLGVLTLAAGPRAARLRVFLLTLLVVDDVVALLVVSFVYPGRIDPVAVAAAAGLFVLLLTMRAVAARQFRARGTSTAALLPLSVLTGVALWLALFESGFDPVVSGLVIGLLTNAYERDPGIPAPVSPNERIRSRLHPLTSMVVVPVFALANAGLHVDGYLLAAALASPITWGIVLAYVVGKPLGIAAAARMAGSRLGASELRATALSAGVGFTVSLLIASRAFDGAQLAQAKLGILATALLAPALASAALAARPDTLMAWARRGTSASRPRRGTTTCRGACSIQTC